MVNSGAHVPSSANQGDAASLASEFESLSADYQNVIRFAQHRHGIRVVPLQELKGGFTGAFLYLVSVSSPGSGQLEHLVLKLDRPSAGEPDELERHKRALEQAPPDFAREHMAEVAFDRVELDGAIAIFYRIAGESLHGFRPLDAFQQQSQVQAIFSVVNREILTRWNAVAAGFDQAVHPQSLLSRWLTDRLGPERNIEKFFKEVRRIDADRPGLIVQGRVYPNPLLFAREADLWGRARPIDAIVGFQHGDMNVNNVLVKFGEDGANLESYYLIDFAFFEERMPLLYDQAYLEIAFLLPYVATVDFARWVDLVTGFASQDIPDPQRVPIELAGAAAAISAGRREFDQWIRANHMSLTDDLWGQYWLAATAAGLNFCGKGGLSEQQRLGALIFAAAHLKRYCEKFGVPLPVDFAHLYEASHIGDEPGGRTVVSVSPMPATAEPEINLPVQPTRVIGREEETPEADDLLSDSRLDPRLNRDIGRVFVGRQRELAELTAALEEAVSGHGRLFMLVGEPGIGKTRTTQELASYAENRGAKVFWGRCYEEEGAPPYWPWVQIMRSYVQQASAEQLTTEMGAGAADIAEIVPEIRVKLPDLETPPVLEPEAARFRLFDSITTFLKNASQSQPLMLVLDDLHWADRSSLLLLEFLAREMGSSRLLLVGCYRDTELSRQHPLAETAARLSREPVFRRQVLGGLGQDELGRFVEATTGVQLSQELTNTLYAHTEGNPFFMTEVVRLLSESGELTAGDISTPQGLRIPEGVRELIGQRLNRLSEQCNDLMTTASIIGREFDFQLLNILGDAVSEDQLLQVVDEAVSFHLIEDVPGQMDRYQFSHALVQQTLADGVTTSRRVRLHARIAESLESLYGADAESHAAELAHHFSQAKAVTGAEKLVHYSLLAGEQALAAYAYEDALALFERALAANRESISESGPAFESNTAAIFFGMGHAQVALNQVQEAVTNLTRAFDYYVESEDVSRAVAIAQNSHSTQLIFGMREAIARAIQIVPPDSLKLGHILANHGYCLGMTFDGYDAAEEAFDQALIIARGNNDTGLEMRVLANSGNIEGFHLRWQACLAKSLEALELAPGVDDSYPKIRAQQQAYLALLSANGDIERAKTHAADMRSSAERLRDAVWLPRSFYYETNLFCITGHWASARQVSDKGLTLFPADPILLGQRALLEHQVGDVIQGNEYMRRLLAYGGSETTTTGHSTPVILARISCTTGDGALFDIVLDDAQPILLSSSSRPDAVFFGRCGQALMALQKGDVTLSGELYPALVLQRGTFALATDLAVDRLLGLLSQTMDNLDQATAHFEAALAFCRKAGYRPELAWTCCDYADALRERDGEGDRAKAMSLLDESLAISSELGMKPLIERVQSRRELTESQPARMSEPSPQPERTASPPIQSRDIFVGRQREMAELTAALEEAVSGHGRLFMLAGEPGIGKTRTTQELASYAENRGAKVFWGRCYEEEGAPPYWPWVQTMRSYVQQASAEQLIAELGAGAADIAEIVPEIRSKLPELDSPPTLEPEAARFRLFDSITTFLKNASQSQPLMLVLDDLHWADRSSLLLLEFLARELGASCLLVVGCYRDMELSRQHPLSETLAQVSREPVFRRQVLRGLDQQDTVPFVQATTGVQLSQELAETVYAHTEGNPFFLAEVIRLLAERGELEQQDVSRLREIRIPEGVREAIGQRLNRLSEQCNQALTTASIIGREFDFKLLITLNEEGNEDRVLEALEEALAAHVIEEASGTIGGYQFTHGLIQETLSQELSATRRARLHARVAEALEALYGDDADTHAAELAHHFAQAEAVLGPEKLVHYSLRAGERALAAYAYEDALTHFERGLVAREVALSGTEAASDEEAAALLFGLARAQSATGVGHQLAAAFATLTRAFEYYAEVGNIALAVAAAEFPIAAPDARIPGLAQLMGRAITLVPTESHEAGRLLSRYGGVIGTDGDYEGAQEALGRAITIARREGDVPLEMQTLAYAALVSAQHLRWQESLDNGLRAIELAPGDENPVSEVLSRYWTAASLLRMGHPNAARPHTLVLLDLAERRSTPRLLASNCFVQITFQSCLEGDWKAGREHSDRGLELSPVNPQLLLHRVLLEHETGESAQGEVYLERLLEVMRRGGPDQFLASGRASIAVTAVARITGIPTRLEIAEAALSEPIITPIFALSARAALALLAVQKDDLSAAAEHYTHVRGRQGMMILTVSSVDRLLGLLSQTMGNIDQATGHFEDALGFCRKAGYRPELAWTCCDYADMLRERGGPGDAETAVALLDECLAISSELGMRPLMERVLSRRENLDTESSDDSKSLAMAEEESAITTPTISGPKPNESVAQDAFSLIRDMDSISLSRFNVVPGYSKYDERTRNLLKDARQRIVEGLQHPGQKRENHLLWAAPGSGKTYFVQRVHSTLPDTVEFHEINLARFGQQEFVDALGRLDEAAGPCLCLVDEIDAKPEDVWPYEVLLPYLDAGVLRGAPYIFVMAGSSGSGIDEMKRHIAIRPKGADLLSRVPAINECQIPSLGTGDRLLMAMSQFRQKGREAGKDVQSVEKLGLYYVALNPLLGNARQLREFVVRAVQRMPAGEDRIKYDHLFSAGDPENKAFWSEAVSVAGDLENRYVAVED